MKSVLLSWIGFNDLNYVKNKEAGVGPVIALLQSDYSINLDEIYLLHNNSRKEDTKKYISHIKETYKDKKINFHECLLENPTDYEKIYKIALKLIEEIKKKNKEEIKWHFHTSPGTSQMSSIWLLLAKTKYPATLYQSYKDKISEKQHVKIVDVPFNIALEFIPELKKKADRELVETWNEIPEFTRIIHKSDVMKELLNKAHRIAVHEVPVLILGETGTGKELFSEAIHKGSGRAEKEMKTLNCAAIQETTATAQLFGWKKGAFTGAIKDSKGLFEVCNGGTLFLDEIGDLSLETQTRLLRAIQYGEIQKIGDHETIKVDVRIIAATNKNLMKMVIEGTFREDLFHRINVGILNIPPLRERREDIGLIADHFLNEINDKFSKNQKIFSYKHKKFSENTKNFIKNYSWPGNVRELYHTLQRACIWSDSEVINEKEIKNSIITFPENSELQEIKLDITRPINLKEHLEELKKKYIERALQITNGNKTQAAELLGYNSYQTLSYNI